MPTNHLLEEISAILPTPNGIFAGIPLFIIPQGHSHNVEPPLVPRKARTRKPSEVTEDDLVNLNPVVKHRYPSRARMAQTICTNKIRSMTILKKGTRGNLSNFPPTSKELRMIQLQTFTWTWSMNKMESESS